MPDSPIDLRDLPAEKRTLLALKALRAKKQNEDTVRQFTIPCLPRPEEVNCFPLSSGQERLWFLDQLAPESRAYSVPISVRLRGNLNTSALEQTVQEIVRRHEILRTTLAMQDGQPVQVIAPALELKLDRRDLQYLPLAERELEARRILNAETRQPFNLTQGPLLRATLLQLAEQDHVVLLLIHHIVFDGWSIDVFNRELTALYQAFSQNKPSPLPPLPVQYADFAVWQRARLQGESFQTQLDYWKNQFGGKLPVLELPTDHARPAVPTPLGAKQSWKLSKALVEELKALSRQEGVTLFMTLLTAFSALLSRYTGKDDIVIGAPIANRNYRELEGLIGFFLNTLALRVDLSGGPPFREALGRVQKMVLHAFAHADVPFEKLVQELHPERSLNRRHSLFEVAFIQQNASTRDLQLPELTLSSFPFDDLLEMYSDLNLFVFEGDGELAGVFEYKSDLFDEQTITRLIGHFQRLLEGIVANPQSPLPNLPLLTDAECDQLIFKWNDTEVERPRELSVHELFEEQVRRTPDSLALSFEHDHLTYRELDSRANQLAGRLRSLGVGPDTLVGICMNRSLELVIGVLGILKAGGAYVPLDPEYPQERLAYMLEDTQVPLLLTQRRLLERLPAHQANIICLDAGWETDIQGDIQGFGQKPESHLTPDNLVYIIYTSGSTGRPKGIAMTHGALSNLIRWQCQCPMLSSAKRRLQFASLSFDPSFREIFSTLSSGGNLLLISENTRRDPTSLANFIIDNSVEKILLPFVGLQQLAEAFASQARPLTSLREVGTAGEQLRITPPLEKLFSELQDCSLHNHWGPSESHMVTIFSLQGAPSQWPRLPPIGRPIDNTEIYILDSHLHPVPVGVIGELYIGGVPLARGYLNRPDLTAEKFLPNPFHQRFGMRLYKTGDLGRYLPDGNIQFMGRTDYQVKIRGYRIEPGEIETLLGQHPDVSEAVVMAREDEPGHKRLTAYVVAAPKAQLRTSELRRFLESKLPDYSVPSTFILLESLPLTPTAKVDRRALPAPETQREDDGEIVAPRTPIEKTLADIWAHVLKLEPIGIHDHFISLGGDSLLSFQVIARANRKGLKLTLKQFFDHPTIAELAQLIETLPADSTEQPETARPLKDPSWKKQAHEQSSSDLAPEDVYPLSPMQQGILFHCLYDPSAANYLEQTCSTQPIKLNAAAFEQAWQEVLKRHTILRTAFAWEGLDEPLQRVYPELTLPFQLHDWRHLSPSQQEEHLASYIQEVQREGFELTVAPLLRVALFQVADGVYQFVFSRHHLILDGWSTNLLLNEVEKLYEALNRQQGISWEEDRYRDYIEWLQRQDLTKAEAYWRRVLGGLRGPTSLAHHSNQLTTVTSAGSYSGQQLRLSADLVADVQRMAREHQLTVNTLVQGAWALLLSHYSGDQDVMFGSVVSGRAVELAGTEDMVGLFINTLPVRVNVSGEKVLVDWLKTLQAEQMEAHQYEHSPLVDIQKWSDVPRGTPLFESILTYANYTAPQKNSWTLVSRSLERTGYPLDVLVTANPTMSIRITYQAQLFEAAEIDRMLNHFEALLAGMAANPKSLIAALPLLTQEERRQILVDWNQTQRDFPLDRCFHQLFEAQVERTPDSVAVTCGAKQQTYRELNQSANQLARILIEKGVGPDVVVALLGERGITFLTAMLAVFKAGGAYLPLDPSHPAQRNADLLIQSGVSLVLHTRDSTPALRRALAARTFEKQPRVLVLEEPSNQSAGAENLPPQALPDNLAYIIYTSGSTGKPKGAMVELRGMLNHLFAKAMDLNLTEKDVIAQTASQCFDISVWQFLAALLVGAQTHIVNEDVVHDPSALLSDVENNGVSILETVPSLLRIMLEEIARRDSRPALVKLRWLVPTGEALPPELCREWFSAYSRIPLLNAYGPTECSDDVSHYPIYHAPSDELANMPIGQPVANMRLYVLDSQLRPVPIGRAGELCVSGIGVGRGYYSDPERTAMVFVPDPFALKAGSRLYRTGDQARYLADGTIEFLGRMDQQVKVRGHRIELGEIESAISRTSGVENVVVVVREERPGDMRLAAYIVAHKDQSIVFDELRRRLSEQLPAYMIPSDFVMLDHLPLTDNGKIDRRSLPSPEQSRIKVKDRYEPPRAATELALAEIWSEVLGIEQIGIHDNFFELGGHSLLATRVIARVHQRLNVELAVRVIFESPTLAALAAIIEEKQIAQLGDDKLTSLLAGLDQLSESEAEALLALAEETVTDDAPS